jgi:hypothetical protein
MYLHPAAMLRTIAIFVAMLLIGSNDAITQFLSSPKRFIVALAERSMSLFNKCIGFGVPVLPDV